MRSAFARRGSVDRQRTFVRRAALVALLVMCPWMPRTDRADLLAATPPKDAATKTAEQATPAGDLFQAMKSGQVEVRVFARDAHYVRVFIKNPAKQPISVKLPDVFAARPVLAQQNFFNPGANQGPGFGGPGNNGNNGNQQQQPQAVAGPGNNTARNGNNIWNIPPESVREVRVDSVCLEHGKPDPRSAVAYELVKLEDVCSEPAVESLLVRYGQGDLDRDVVQAAAWNLANGLSWDELQRKSVRVAVNATKPVYTSQQLRLARELTDGARKTAASRKTSAAGLASSKASETLPASPATTDTKPTKLRALETINARK